MPEDSHKKKLYQDCWEYFGADAQIDMLIEEMAELTKELLKARRAGVGINHKPTAEEFADVKICMDQLAEQFKKAGFYDMIQSIEESKVKRLQKILDDEMKCL